MLYTFNYPDQVARLTGRRGGRVFVTEDFLRQTHEKLIERVSRQDRFLIHTWRVPESIEVVWDLLCGSAERFFSLLPIHDTTSLKGASLEVIGSRFVVHWDARKNGVVDRLAEVIHYFPLRRVCVSDIEIADQSVTGIWQRIYGVELAQTPTGAGTEITISTHALHIFSSFEMFVTNHRYHQVERRLGNLRGR